MSATYTMKLKQYLFNKIAKPREKLGGHAICPFIKQYKDKIVTVETGDWDSSVTVCCELLDVLGLEAVVIAGPNCDYDWLHDKHTEWNEKYRIKDREILFMYPDTVEPPLDLDYNWQESPLVIVQKRSTLQQARKTLKTQTNYYDYYQKG